MGNSDSSKPIVPEPIVSEDARPLLAPRDSTPLVTNSMGAHFYGGAGKADPAGQRGSAADDVLPTHNGAGGEKKIGVWMLVGLVYFSVSGGPLGIEVAVKAGGPLLALLGFIIMPLIWSSTEAAMTAELSVAYPEVRCQPTPTRRSRSRARSDTAPSRRENAARRGLVSSSVLCQVVVCRTLDRLPGLRRGRTLRSARFGRSCAPCSPTFRESWITQVSRKVFAGQSNLTPLSHISNSHWSAGNACAPFSKYTPFPLHMPGFSSTPPPARPITPQSTRCCCCLT